MRLGVSTFNIHGVQRNTAQAVIAASTAHLIADRPDIACFQEVFYADQLAALDAALLGPAPAISRLAGGTIEEARSSTGTNAYQVRVSSPTGGIFGVAPPAGVVLYTSLPRGNYRFRQFAGGAMPDVLANKGVVGMHVVKNNVVLFVAGTHLNDSENDRVDGRARRGDLATIGRLVLENRRVTRQGALIEIASLVLGDFNIDASKRTGLDGVLFNDHACRMGSLAWDEAGWENATHNTLARPVPTTVPAPPVTIDLVLTCAAENGPDPYLVRGSYRARDDFGSDHRMVRAELEFA
jgi:hypothetical protein